MEGSTAIGICGWYSVVMSKRQSTANGASLPSASKQIIGSQRQDRLRVFLLIGCYSPALGASLAPAQGVDSDDYKEPATLLSANPRKRERADCKTIEKSRGTCPTLGKGKYLCCNSIATSFIIHS